MAATITGRRPRSSSSAAMAASRTTWKSPWRAGLMPNLKSIVAKGENLRGHSVIPSFTNPNNLSIVTGRPPAVHGICGNYLIDPATGQETMMNDPKWLRAPTIFEAFQKAGAQDRRRHGQGQAAPAARQGPERSMAVPSAFPPRRPTRPRWPTMASKMSAPWSAWPCPMSIPRNCPNSSSRRASSCWPASSPTSCISRPPTMCSTNMRRARLAPIASTR